MQKKVGFKLSWLVVISFLVTSAQAAPFGELISFWDDHEDNSRYIVDHSRWQEILDKYLDDQHPSGINRFDYGGMSAGDESRLEAYLQTLQSIEPRQLNSAEQKAYWINLYNATTVLVVAQRGGELSSIRQIRSGLFTRGPWQLDVLNVVQQDLSLDDIEHGILRPIWRDNRIHYAVNCASLGCPNLLKTAFTADNTEGLLDQAARAYINHPRGVNIRGGALVLSSIYDWYAEDFGTNFAELIAHISRYANPALATQLQNFEQADYDYDWTLNRPE